MHMGDVEISILGAVEMRVNSRRINLGTPKQRCLFVALTVNPGRPVTIETIASRLWGAQLPGDVNNNIYTYVARLRRLLRQESTGVPLLACGAESYVLEIEPQCVDLWQVRALVERADMAVTAGRDDEGFLLYRDALRLWRAEPLCGLRGAWVERTRTALKHEQLAVLIRYSTVGLRLGRHEQLIGELAAVLSENPLDEALASQLMLSLYRSDQRADALAVFHRIRAGLENEIGLDPGPGLRQLYRDLLRSDSVPGARMAIERSEAR
jgi:DNA-binding SARP family transcriptional activator